jgi:adenylate cyclase
MTPENTSDLLDGLTGQSRTERAELVDWLLGQGISTEEIRTSHTPTLLPARRLLGHDGTYVSARRISEMAGLDVDLLMRFQRAAGLPHVDDPEAPAFMRADGEFAVHIRHFLDLGIDPGQLLTVVRLLAEGLSRAAEMMRASLTASVMHPGVTEREIATSATSVVEDLAPRLGPMIQDMLMLQLRHAVETEAFNAAERAAGAQLPGARMVAVGFADLVGFTRLGEELRPEELEVVADRLADLARDTVAAPVRMVKTIGDAVMLVSTDAAALVEALLDLVALVDADPTLPQVRAGVAHGAAVSRAGDWFGSPVNTASRVTAIARPGTVLVTEAAQTEVGDPDRLRWSYVGARWLRGIPDDVRLYRARGAQPLAEGPRTRFSRHQRGGRHQVMAQVIGPGRGASGLLASGE